MVEEQAEESGFEIASRLQMVEMGAWMALVWTSQLDAETIEDLRLDIEAELGFPVRLVDGAAEPFPELLAAAARNPKDDAILVTGLERLDAKDWETLDINRSRLERRGPLILGLTGQAAAQLSSRAPNVKSFLGASFFPVGKSGWRMTSAERAERIRDYEEHFGITSKEVEELALAGRLPPDPHYAGWLILLDRGDLI